MKETSIERTSIPREECLKCSFIKEDRCPFYGKLPSFESDLQCKMLRYYRSFYIGLKRCPRCNWSIRKCKNFCHNCGLEVVRTRDK